MINILGSHDSWSSEGNHEYKKLPNNALLIDKCSKGNKWETWKNLVIGMFDPTENYNSPSPLGFLRFQGRWGNKKRDCGIYETVSGECVLNDGPSGPEM